MFKRIFTKLFSPDERFIYHRYYSTRLAAIVGSLVIAGLLLYEFNVNHVLRWDLVIIAGAMGLTKIAAMIYYQLTH